MGLGCKIIAIAGLLGLLGCVGSYQPEIGDSPFECEATEEQPCPVEYDCIEGICRPHGWKPPADSGMDGNEQDTRSHDAVPTDAAGHPDAATDDAVGQGGGG